MANVQTAAERTLVANLKRLKVKPKALAEAMGVSESMASMALAGKRGIPIWHLNAIAEGNNILD